MAYVPKYISKTIGKGGKWKYEYSSAPRGRLTSMAQARAWGQAKRRAADAAHYQEGKRNEYAIFAGRR